jgi:hypothetical protein
MGVNCMLENYLMKIEFSKYLLFDKHVLKWTKYHNIIHIYIHHSRMIEKLHNGEKTLKL